jgi:hypothetical protein
MHVCKRTCACAARLCKLEELLESEPVARLVDLRARELESRPVIRAQFIRAAHPSHSCLELHGKRNEAWRQNMDEQRRAARACTSLSVLSCLVI